MNAGVGVCEGNENIVDDTPTAVEVGVTGGNKLVVDIGGIDCGGWLTNAPADE